MCLPLSARYGTRRGSEGHSGTPTSRLIGRSLLGGATGLFSHVNIWVALSKAYVFSFLQENSFSKVKNQHSIKAIMYRQFHLPGNSGKNMRVARAGKFLPRLSPHATFKTFTPKRH